MSFVRVVLDGLAKKLPLPVYRSLRRVGRSKEWRRCRTLGAHCLAFGVPFGLMGYCQPVHSGLIYYYGEEGKEYAESPGLLPRRKKPKKSPQEEGMESAS